MEQVSQTKVASFLGTLCVNFNTTEFFVQILVNALISGDSNLNLIITSELSFRARVNLLNTLVLYKASKDTVEDTLREKILTKLASVTKLLDEVEEKRNACIHSHWWYGMGANDAIVRSKFTAKRKGLKGQWEPSTMKDLEDVIQKTVDASQEVMQLNAILTEAAMLHKITTGLEPKVMSIAPGSPLVMMPPPSKMK